MRIETVEAETKEKALVLCPWACEAIEVDGYEDKAWTCYESIDDYNTALNQY